MTSKAEPGNTEPNKTEPSTTDSGKTEPSSAREERSHFSRAYRKFLRTFRSSRVYPKRVMDWIALSFIVVVLPLLLAVGSAMFFMQQISVKSEHAVLQATQAVRLSRNLGDALNGMERNARVYQVVGDESLLNTYTELHRNFETVAAKLLSEEQDPALLKKITRLLSIDAELHELFLEEPPNSSRAVEALEQFPVMRDIVRDLIEENSDLIEHRVQALHDYSSGAQTVMMWEAFMVIPLAILFGFLIMVRLTRPMKQLDRHIRRLGDGGTDTAISVDGPEDIRSLGERLEWLRCRLEELADQKRLFLQHISHELKTPMASIREGAGLLQDGVAGSMNEKQMEIVEILTKSGIQLQKRIEDLLAYSVSEELALANGFEDLDFDDIVRTVVEDHRLPSRVKGVTFTADLAKITIRGDQEKLTAVIDNLISNAVKFSPENATVSVSLVDDGGVAHLDVIDEGPGIAAEEMDLVFQPFFQGEAEYSGPLKGTGLGLSIARLYVRAHRGDIKVMPAGRGAHMRVELPIDDSTDGEKGNA